MNSRPSKTLARYAAATNEVKRIWRLACLHDGVGTDNKFVVFTTNNPFNTEYNAAVKVMMKAKKAYMTSQDRAARREVISSLGMKEVRGALGGRYIE